MPKRIPIFVLFLLICLSSKGQQVRKYVNEFLEIGATPRGIAMANTNTSSVDEVSAIYYNPAGLTKIKSNIQASFTHSEYFGGITNFDFGGIAIKSGEFGAIGLGIVRFGVDNIPNTLDLIGKDGLVDYSRVTNFSATDLAILISYGHRQNLREKRYRKEPFRYGGTMKIITRSVGPFATGFGVGLDGGIMFGVNAGGNIGIQLKDVTSTFMAWSFNFTDEQKRVLKETGNEIPAKSTEIALPSVNAAYNQYYEINKNIAINTEAGFRMTFDGKRNVLVQSKFINLDPKIGFEGSFKKILFLRAGLGEFQYFKGSDPLNPQKETFSLSPSLGFGIKLKAISFDYAYYNAGSVNAGLYSHILGIKLDINKRKKKESGE